ncbi:glycosyltransferase [Luteimonas saliphila]|uniref:glycosyltransferase n=1 Tax=Luteimonas saliphila TaxID=2804919 RepID=UPI00192DC729|nr:glycosyltransferase [Luteimonas saliphila]
MVVQLDSQTREKIAGSAILDPEWYASRNPDVSYAGMDPLQHYLALGIALRRPPGPEFDPLYYAGRYPDVDARDGLALLLHYLDVGRAEARQGADWNAGTDEALGMTAGQGAGFLTGHLDKAAGDTIAGWAVDCRQNNAPVTLELWVDGSFVMNFRTSTPRSDVIAEGIGAAAAGFSLQVLPGTIRDRQQVEVRFAGGGPVLDGAPATFFNARPRGEMPLSWFLRAHRQGVLRPVTVVVPVFNAPAAVGGCLESLARTAMPPGTQVLVVNDGSTDEAIPTLLLRFSSVPGFSVVENERNIGYTRTINKAISLAEGRDVVLLNSDTVVSDRWLHNLRYCAYSQPDIGTATALSDNAGAFSVPEIGTNNPIPPHLDRALTARLVSQAGAGFPIDVPTGNGFCLYLRRDALEEVGAFDEAHFPTGYGEENDLCMRMMYAGWRNVVCDKAYVYHLRTQSFGESKARLVAAGGEQLAILYPEYKGLTARFSDLQFAMLRATVRGELARRRAHPPRKRILFVISTTTGGTPQTNLDLMRAVEEQYEGYLLRCDSTQVVLSRLANGALEQVECRALHFRITQVPHRSDEYDRIVSDMLFRHSIDLVHVRHIAWHGLGLAAAAKALGVPVVCSFHDFYTLCPSVNLLDVDNVYRGAGIEGDRLNPLWTNQPMPAAFLPRWRAMMQGFLDDCDLFVTTSQAAADLVTQVFPATRDRLRIIPHGRDFPAFEQVTARPAPDRRLKVLVPGNIGPSKGSLLIEGINGLANGDIEFHFLGRTAAGLKRIGVHHGEYGREEFADKVRAIRPDIGIVFSVCPETYCHTLTEMWASGIPVLGLDLGSVGERIRQSGAGWVAPLGSSPQQLLDVLRSIRDAPGDHAARTAQVHAWQRTTGTADSVRAMAFRYRLEYHGLLEREGNVPARVGLVLKGDASTGRHPATAHIRLLRPMAALQRSGDILFRAITPDELVAGGAAGLDMVVIQRDAVPSTHTEAVLDALSRQGIPHVFEIDDLLWEIPEQHTDHSIDEDAIASMDRIASTASIITTSTQPLADKLRRHGRPVRVIANALDGLLWQSPLDEAWIEQVCAPLGLTDGRRRILYMGTNSHARDLEMIDPVLGEIRQRHPDVQFLQIGGGYVLSHSKAIHRPAGTSDYPSFVAWFRAVASRCTFAIAPLVDDDFNAAKSNVKYLDYLSAGLPAVYSDVPAYRTSVGDGTGILCPNQHDSWLPAIDELLSSGMEGLSPQSANWQDQVQATSLQSDGSVQVWRDTLRSLRHR